MKNSFLTLLSALLLSASQTQACSIIYYMDEATGKVYVANNEDFWYDTKAYIQINPKSNNEFARLWYGWDHFAQGGVNEFGLFFDGAVTPKQELPEGHHSPDGKNIGDELLATCKTVEDALNYMRRKKIAIAEGHMMFGDASGNAVVVEWVNGVEKIIRATENTLIATNFLLSDTTAGNYPCYRYHAIEEQINQLKQSDQPISFNDFSHTIERAVQPPQADKEGRIGGTLYTSFINITDMEMILVYKLDNTKITKLNLRDKFKVKKKQKIKLK